MTVADVLPTGFTALSLSGTGWTCNLGTVSCVRSDVLAVGANYPTVTLAVTSANAGTFTNVATVACAACESGAATSNNTGTDEVVVIPSVNLSISKTNGVTSLVAGQTVSYDITVSNAGPANAAGAVLTDPAAAGLSCTSVTCSVAPGAAVCPAAPINLSALQGSGVAISDLPANSSVVFRLSCLVTATGL